MPRVLQINAGSSSDLGRGSSKWQQSHRPQMSAIVRHRSPDLRGWPLIDLPLVHTEEVPCICEPARAAERGRGMGHLTLWCGTCSAEDHRGTMLYEPPHEIGHSGVLSNWTTRPDALTLRIRRSGRRRRPGRSAVWTVTTAKLVKMHLPQGMNSIALEWLDI
jgi:hypothetical protein